MKTHISSLQLGNEQADLWSAVWNPERFLGFFQFYCIMQVTESFINLLNIPALKIAPTIAQLSSVWRSSEDSKSCPLDRGSNPEQKWGADARDWGAGMMGQ